MQTGKELEQGFIAAPCTFFELKFKNFLRSLEPGKKKTFAEAATHLSATIMHGIFGTMFGLVDPDMLVKSKIKQALASFPVIGMDTAFRVNCSPDHTLKSFSGTIP